MSSIPKTLRCNAPCTLPLSRPPLPTTALQEWCKIAHDFLKDSRTGTQCATHWKMVLKPALLKGVWSPEEDAVIYDCLARGVSDWSEVAALLPKRKPKHCRERWNNHLDPDLSKGPDWTAAEEVTLVSAVEAHGTNWSLVARHFPGRKEVAIEQHWNEVVFRGAMGGGGGAGGVRRSRSGRDSSSTGGVTGGCGRGRARASTLPVESSGLLAGAPAGRDLITRETEQQPAVTLTEREKALMDHAFKTGLSAATGAGGGAGGAAPVPASTLLVPAPNAGGSESLTLSAEEDDLFAPLTAALLRDGDGSGCSPSGMPPPSPTSSPLKAHKQQPDYTSIGDQLGDCWGVDDDPALADLYQSLDNIGESLFNEDNLELSFDFDSLDKPAPSCGSRSGGGPNSDQHTSPSKGGWDGLLTSTSHEKDGSPFRRAAAKAAETLELQLSPNRRASQTSSLAPSKSRSIEEACARAAAAAAAAAEAAQAPPPQAPLVSSVSTVPPVSTVSTVPPVSAVPAVPAARQPTPELVAGPRVKQGFLRQLLSSVDVKPEKQAQTPFSTVRGCLSEANAPPPPPPPPSSSPVEAGSTSPAGGGGASSGGGGENQAPQRRGQPLSIALFAHDSVWSSTGGDCISAVAPSLMHGKAEVKIPPPQVPGSGAPLSSLPANRFN